MRNFDSTYSRRLEQRDAERRIKLLHEENNNLLKRK